MRYLLGLVLAIPAYAQFGSAKSVINGNGAPNAALCASANNVGKVYARKDGAAAASTFYVCANTGASTYAWELSGSGGGASAVSGMTDLKSTRTSSTVLTVAAGGARIGTVNQSFTEATATLSGTSASSTAYVYISSAGVLVVGHNGASTVTCSGCTTATGVSAFPVDSIPVATATYASALWDVSGVTDKRVLVSRSVLAAGSGITISENAAGVQEVSLSAASISPFQHWQNGPIGANGSGNETAVFTANQTRWSRFTLTYRATFTGVGVAANVGITTTTNGLKFAVADTAGTILYTTTTLTTCAGSTRCQTAFSSPITLSPGDYYMGVTTDSTAFRLLQPNDIASTNSPLCRAVEEASPAIAGTGTIGSGTGSSVAFGASMGSLTSWSCDGGSNTFATGYIDAYFYN